MGRIRQNIEVAGAGRWTLFDSGARYSYIVKEAAVCDQAGSGGPVPSEWAGDGAGRGPSWSRRSATTCTTRSARRWKPPSACWAKRPRKAKRVFSSAARCAASRQRRPPRRLLHRQVPEPSGQTKSQPDGQVGRMLRSACRLQWFSSWPRGKSGQSSWIPGLSFGTSDQPLEVLPRSFGSSGQSLVMSPHP